MRNNCKLTQENWAALQQIYENLYKTDSVNNTGEFWHYTSAKGVLGIFRDYIEDADDVIRKIDHCSLLASNIRFMNDSKEYEEGVECYKEFCKNADSSIQSFLKASSANPIIDNIYLVSFCNEGDLLSQWKWYGKNSGISLRFNIDNIAYRTFEYKNEEGVNEEICFTDTHTKPLRVKYTKKEKADYFSKLLEYKEICASKAYELLGLAFIPFCKHEGFAEEKESRLIFYIGDLRLSKSLKAKFEMVYNTFEEGRIKPALNVRMESVNKEKEIDNVISEVIVGPGDNQELIFNFLIHAFDRKNYYYHKEQGTKKISWNKFISINDQKIYFVKCRDDKYREAYKCENGVVIMKSTIPFRG